MGGRLNPEGCRRAARIMRLAAELRLPLVTFIDTPGAHLDYDSEARGLAGALSSCLANMSGLPGPGGRGGVGGGGGRPVGRGASGGRGRWSAWSPGKGAADQPWHWGAPTAF